MENPNSGDNLPNGVGDGSGKKLQKAGGSRSKLRWQFLSLIGLMVCVVVGLLQQLTKEQDKEKEKQIFSLPRLRTTTAAVVEEERPSRRMGKEISTTAAVLEEKPPSVREEHPPVNFHEGRNTNEKNSSVDPKENLQPPLFLPTVVPNETVDSGRECWLTLNVLDFGAVGDNKTDDTEAFRAAFRAIDDRASSEGCLGERSGGEVIVPSGHVFQTVSFEMTDNSILTVDGIIHGLPNQTAWPAIRAPPSYGRCADMRGLYRRQALVFAKDKHNLTIRGGGTIDGGGWYWYPFFFNFSAAFHIGRPHIMELYNCTDIEITGVTMKDSAFWTLHPIYCKNVHIHHVHLDSPSCRKYKCANTDGIDIDSSENVLVEYNHIEVGDDHVTVLAGKLPNKPGWFRTPPTRNVTIQHNTLGTGMGLAFGSSTAGGISDVLYYNNTMRAPVRGQPNQGVHIKLRDRFGGYVRNVAWVDNVFYSVNQAIKFESGYQGNKKWKACTSKTCPEVRDILVKNLTVHKGKPGHLQCYKNRPCHNITFENIQFHDPKARIACENVHSGTVIGGNPKGLFEKCTNLTYREEAKSIKN